MARESLEQSCSPLSERRVAGVYPERDVAVDDDAALAGCGGLGLSSNAFIGARLKR